MFQAAGILAYHVSKSKSQCGSPTHGSGAAVQRCFMWSPLALWTRICWAGTGWDEDSRPLCEALEGEPHAAAQAASLQVLGYRSLGELTHCKFCESSLRCFYLRIYINEISRFEQALANKSRLLVSDQLSYQRLAIKC